MTDAVEAARRILDAIASIPDGEESVVTFHNNDTAPALLEVFSNAGTVARALLSSRSSPTAGYDQLSKSHFCIDCKRHWYGDKSGCSESDCPFRSLTKEDKDGQ